MLCHVSIAPPISITLNAHIPMLLTRPSGLELPLVSTVDTLRTWWPIELRASILSSPVINVVYGVS